MKYLNTLKQLCFAYLARLRQRSALAVASITVALLSSPAFAALPTAVTTTATSGDYIQIGQEYFKKGFLFLGLLLASYGLYTVAGGAIAKFNEFRIGRAELGDVVIYAVVGVVILVILVYLLTEASTIL